MVGNRKLISVHLSHLPRGEECLAFSSVHFKSINSCAVGKSVRLIDVRMDKCIAAATVNSSSTTAFRKNNSPKNRNIVRDLLKESSLSSDDTEFMDLPLPPVPKTVEDMALNRRSVEIENLDVHPCVAAYLMSRMEYYIGSPS